MCAAQEYVTVTGTVTNHEDQAPLAFANISIKGTPIGTVTNASGDFEFHIPSQHSGDTLVISYIGFETLSQKISQLVNVSGKQVFTLKPSAVMLKEVVVSATDLTGKEIVQKAVKRIRDNYPAKQFCLEGFFREIEEENGKYVLLTEAAIDLYDSGYTSTGGRFREAIDIREVRRSLRYSQRADGDNIGFALMDLLENNDVRYKRNMLNTKMNSHTLDSLTVYNNRPVYVISMSNWADRGKLYIDAETFAFIKIGVDRRSRKANKPYYQVYPYQDSLRCGRISFTFSVEFQEYDGKLFVKRMYEHEENDFYHPKNKKSILIKSVETLELIVTNVRTGVSSNDARRLSFNARFSIGPYNENFWKNYNMVKLSPLSEKLIRDLEKDVSLQEQFKSSKK
jgi:hypothetical protein